MLIRLWQLNPDWYVINTLQYECNILNQIDAIQEVSEINMGKLIFYVLIALLIYWIIKSRRPKQEEHEASSEAVEDMVNCAQCGVYLPKSEAIHSHTKYFCSHEHCNLYIKSST